MAEEKSVATELLKEGFAQIEQKKQAEEEKKKGVHVDFKTAGKSVAASTSPFQEAKEIGKRFKALIWGESGVGKTVLALQFPKPVVIDTEGGTDLYGDEFKFEVKKTTNPDEIIAAVDWLLTNRHEFRTLIVDPITVFWEALQHKWSDIFLRRKKSGKGFHYEFYDLQAKDWLTIKSEWKEFIRKLISLDMNVIVTAREKDKYAESSGTDFMRVVGETFDGEKSLPYMFDIVIRMYLDEKGRRMASVLKDRSNHLPTGNFECKYEEFEKLFGKKYLTKKSTPAAPTPEEIKPIAPPAPPVPLSLEELHIKVKGLIGGFKLTPEQIQKRLAAYGATSIENLTAEAAEVIISKLEEAISQQKLEEAKSKQKPVEKNPAEKGKEAANA